MIKRKKEKVYCDECVYCTDRLKKSRADCSYPKNLNFVDKSNWFSSRKIPRYISKPYAINKNNDCAWYKF